MPDFNDYTRSPAEQMRADMELSNGAEPLDELLAELDKTEATWAEGAALYGPGGLFDAQRKAKLCVIGVELRDMLTKNGGKVTEASIDQMAHADDGYLKFLDEHERLRGDWLLLNAQRDAIMLRVQRGQALLRVNARMVA